MKSTLIIAISFFISLQMQAQCRLIQAMATDSSVINEYIYDKQGNLTLTKIMSIFEGKKFQGETSYTYNDQNKVVLAHHTRGGTLFGTRHFLYNNNRIVQLVDVYLVDSTVFIGEFYYNDKGQLSKVSRKSNKGDTIQSTYEWADEGWFKRLEVRSNYSPIGSFALENVWDNNNTLKDPERMFFEGQLIEFNSVVLIPHTPLSVKGNVKSQKSYLLNKSGQFELTETSELYDFKPNSSGYVAENKYKTNDKTYTFVSQYEGCKN